jgi:hypothetical protein
MTLSVAAFIPTKQTTFSAGELPDAIGNNAEKPTPIVATPIVRRRQKESYLEQVHLEM